MRVFLRPYEVGPIRPPSEAQSLLIRVTRNCQWNRCLFCPVYKTHAFNARPLVDVLSDIDRAGDFHGDVFKNVFLQDADALLTPTNELTAILRRIKERFPSVKRITTYGRPSTIYKKSFDELKELRDAGLSRIHRGLETGCDRLLKYMLKGVSARIQIIGGLRVKEAGISLSDYVMPGLGGNLMFDGKPAWQIHVEETARVLNEVNPDYIRLRTLAIVPGTPLAEKAKAGEFSRLSDVEIVKEIRLFIELLEGVRSKIESDHILNVLMEVRGKLPEDRQRMISAIDNYIALSPDERLAFRFALLRDVLDISTTPFTLLTLVNNLY